jgi:LacI family transcriptional regulator
LRIYLTLSFDFGHGTRDWFNQSYHVTTRLACLFRQKSLLFRQNCANGQKKVNEMAENLSRKSKSWVLWPARDKSGKVASLDQTKIRQPRRVLLVMDYYLHQVHEGVVDYARRAGWVLDARSHHFGQLPIGWQADGILAFIGSNQACGPAVLASGLPVVNMSQYGMKFGFPSVQLDNQNAGQLAADHLIGRGIHELAMVQFSPKSRTSEARRSGFAEATLGYGRRFHSMVCPFTEDDGALPVQMISWLKTVLVGLPRPLGVFTEGDNWAVETILVCQQLCLRVPEDVAVVGIDNDPLVVEVAPVPVSSVDNNLHGLGAQAAELLDRILDGATAPTDPILISPRAVIQRQSTNVLAVANEEVAAAIGFIHAKFREAITVADVASESHVSRRRLQDLFLEHVGRTISQEITRCRLELAQRMLFESPMKISLIAEQCGLGSGVQMCKVFGRELRMSPKEYRQKNTAMKRM